MHTVKYHGVKMFTPISLTRLVNLSIGSPEVGAVNFNALHRLLHAIVKRLDIENGDLDIAEAFSTAPAPVKVSDGAIDLEKASDYRFSKDSAPFVTDHIETSRVLKAGEIGSVHSISSKDRSILSTESKDKSRSTNKVEQESTVISKRRQTTQSRASDDREISNINRDSKPIIEMWQYVSLSKKVEANETGVKAAMELLQDTFEQLKETKQNCTDLQEQVNVISIQQNEEFLRLQERLTEIETKMEEKQDSDMINVEAEEKMRTERMSKEALTDALITVEHDTSITPVSSVVSGHLQTVPEKISSSSLPQLSQVIQSLDELKINLAKYPTVEEVVTWEGLETNLSVLRGDIADVKSVNESKDNGRTDDVHTCRLSNDLNQVLESLGKSTTRISQLEEKFTQMEQLVESNLGGEEEPHQNLDGGSKTRSLTSWGGKLEGLSKQVDDITVKFEDLEHIKRKIFDLEVLISDVPARADDPIPIGVKSAISISILSPSTAGRISEAAISEPVSTVNMYDVGVHSGEYSRNLSRFSSTDDNSERRSKSTRVSWQPDGLMSKQRKTKKSMGSYKRSQGEVITDKSKHDVEEDTSVHERPPPLNPLGKQRQILFKNSKDSLSDTVTTANRRSDSSSITPPLQQEIPSLQQEGLVLQKEVLTSPKTSMTLSNDVEDSLGDRDSSVKTPDIRTSNSVRAQQLRKLVEQNKEPDSKPIKFTGKHDDYSEMSEDVTMTSSDTTVDIPVRYSQTLREVLYNDYMAVIEPLKQRLEVLEHKLSSPTGRTEPTLRSIHGTEKTDDKLFELLQRMDLLQDDTNRRIKDIDNEMIALLEHSVQDEEAMRRLRASLTGLQSQLEAIRSVNLQLQSQNELANAKISELTTNVEQLDNEKMDRSVVERELALKANVTDVERKVDSLDFEMISQELQTLINDLINKLLTLETTWKKAHTQLESNIKPKVSKDEMAEQRAAIMRKMRDLKVKIKELQSVSHPVTDEAAGLRRRLQFRCLSCDKPVTTGQHGLGDGKGALHISHSEISLLRKHAKGANTSNEGCDQKRDINHSDLKAYMVHFGKKQEPKVFITRSKSRMKTAESTDMYSRPRSCGGKHTLTQNNIQGKTIQSGRKQLLKDLFMNEEFVAAGVLKQEEQMIKGADGRSYRSREDVIQVDADLTEAIHVTNDPIIPIVDVLQQADHTQHSKPNKSKSNNVEH